MGFPNTALVLPAVMLLNPGSSASELSDLLFEVGGKSRFVGRGNKSDNRMYHGLFGVGHLLGLPHRASGFDIGWGHHLNSDGVRRSLSDDFSLYINLIEGARKSVSFNVEVKKFRMGDVLDVYSDSDFSEYKGKFIFPTTFYDGHGNLVPEAVGRGKELEKYKVLGCVSSNNTNVFYERYKVSVQEVNSFVKKESFFSIQDLVAKYPVFNPEKLFDFSYTHGKFRDGSEIKNHWWNIPLCWCRQGFKHYLALNTINNLPMYTQREKSFIPSKSDFLLTLKILDNKLWDLLYAQNLFAGVSKGESLFHMNKELKDRINEQHNELREIPNRKYIDMIR